MFKKFKIRTRLLLSFLIVVLFTLIIGITGYSGLTSIGNLAVKTIDNVRILNDVYDNCAVVNTGISAMLYIQDNILSQYIAQKTREHTVEILEEMDIYLEIQEQFIDIFSPGEMQDMSVIFEVYRDSYIPIANEIFYLIEQGQREEALSVYVNRLTPIYNTIIYTINAAFMTNLEHSEIRTRQRNYIAQMNALLMILLLFLSLFVSIPLALSVSASIAHEEEKALASAQSKSKFLAKMSHEIRTPMNAITGMAELALREDMPASAREHIITIKQAGANLLSIINDILDFSKIDSGKLEVASNDYLFSSLVNDVINIIRMKIIDSQIRFIVNIDSNIPNALLGDETRIRQILLNLLSNAFKYTDKGFVSLDITGEINAGIENLTIIVSDTGRGIKQEDIDRLFEDFIQVDLAGNKGIEGTGLGLAITHGIVKALSGSISVYSEYGKGSSFTVTLPQEIRGKDKLASVENPKEKSVVVYEPRKIYADSIIRTINNLGVDFRLVNNENELCEEMKKGEYAFAFIASKIYERNKEIRTKNFPNVKIILLTGYYDIITDRNLGIISMPAHSITIANILNGISGSARGETNKIIAKFAAPEARILLVDDINTNLKVVEGLLSPYRMQLDLCQSGPEAINYVMSRDYDIVFMDHMMPDMDGIEATMLIRNLEKEKGKEKNLTIVALTANAVSGMREMFLEKGFNDFLAKPIDIPKLDEILERWIPQEKKVFGEIEDVFPQHKGSLSFPEIPGVDTEKGLAMTGGTEQGYISVLLTFSRDAEERLPLLHQTPSAETMAIFVTQVHALKSAAASIGAAEISAQAAKLETAGRSKDMIYIQKNLAAFTDNLNELSNYIASVLKKTSDESGVADNVDVNLLPLFQELEKVLKLQNLSEIDKLMNNLDKKTTDKNTKELLAKVSDDVLMTEFDSAIAKIKDFFHDKS